MELKQRIDQILSEKQRSLRWLANQMGKTFEGLKLSLIKGSLKYNDLVKMAAILETSPAIFFETGTRYLMISEMEELAEPRSEYTLKKQINIQIDLIAALKNQIRDKNRIIAMLDANK